MALQARPASITSRMAVILCASILLSEASVSPPRNRTRSEDGESNSQPADTKNHPAATLPAKKPSLQILYGGGLLNGRTFIFTTRGGIFTLSSWQVKNASPDSTPAGLSVRLYFSDSVGSSARPEIWEKQTSTDAAYPAEFYWKWQAPLGAGQTWDLPDFENSGAGLIRPVKAKLMVFSGGGAPAEAIFLIRPAN